MMTEARRLNRIGNAANIVSAKKLQYLSTAVSYQIFTPVESAVRDKKQKYYKSHTLHKSAASSSLLESELETKFRARLLLNPQTA